MSGPPYAVIAAAARTAAGRWYRDIVWVPVTETNTLTALVGVYVLLAADRSVIHLGQAARTGGVAARVREHFAIPQRRSTVHTVMVLELDEQTPIEILSVIEGSLAAALRLTKSLPSRRWPRTEGWAGLVSN